jgi:hypothetical protein
MYLSDIIEFIEKNLEVLHIEKNRKLGELTDHENPCPCELLPFELFQESHWH